MITVLLVDDHPVFRSGLRTLIATYPDLEVVAEASDGMTAVELAGQLRPDVVLMDLDLPGVGGLEATRRIRSLPGVAPRVLVLTMHAADATLVAAVRAGASGYLLKGADADDVARGINAVARGDAYFGAGAGERALRAVAEPMTESPFPGLTDRELAVLALLADGTPNAAIARELGLSSKTVQNYVSAVLSKLGLRDRTAAAIVARDAGLGRTSR